MTVLVDNEAGVLARVVGLFSGRGYNIESLTVAEVDPRQQPVAHHHRHQRHADGDRADRDPARRLVPVHKVTDLTVEGRHRARDGADQGGGHRRQAGRGAAHGRRLPRRVIDTTGQFFVFEITGTPEKIDSFVDLMRPLGLVDVARTGVVAISRGGEAF